MGSPITFSGFNSIDFNQILNAVMQQERVPYNRLQTQKTTLETQNSQFGTLAGKLTTFETAVDALKVQDSLAFLSATSTDTGVGVSTTTGTVTGTYDVAVTELARAQVKTSTTTYGSVADVAATGGSLTLTPTNGDPATVVTISASTSLQGLADAINAKTDSPASASIVQTSPGVYQLMLAARETGTDNTFTVTSGLTGGPALTFAGVDTQTALDAELTVNGLPVTSSSNTLTDVVSGVTLTLTKKDVAATVTVARDLTKAKDAITKFINSYNDIVTFAKDQASAAAGGKASIGRDPLLKGLRDALRSAAMDEYTTGGSFERLAAIGIGFDMTGKMILDSEVFDDAIAAAPADVQTLISGASGEGQAFGAISTLLDDYTKAGGLVALIRERITDQVSTLSTRLDTLDSQLAVRRIALQQQYTAADLAMTRLKSQSASLSSASGGYRLF